MEVLLTYNRLYSTCGHWARPGIVATHHCDQMPDHKSSRKERFISTHYCKGFGCAYLASCTQTEFYSRWVRQTETTWAPETRYCQVPGLSDHFLPGRVYYRQKLPEPHETWSSGYYVTVQTDFYRVSSVFLIQSISVLAKMACAKELMYLAVFSKC